MAFDLLPLGELGLYSEAVYAQNLDRSSVRDLPVVVVDATSAAIGDVVDENQLGVYFGALQHLGELFAAGARVDYFDPNTDTNDDQLTWVTLVAHAYPTAPLRLTLAYELRFEDPSVDDNQLWLRAQVKY